GASSWLRRPPEIGTRFRSDFGRQNRTRPRFSRLPLRRGGVWTQQRGATPCCCSLRVRQPPFLNAWPCRVGSKLPLSASTWHALQSSPVASAYFCLAMAGPAQIALTINKAEHETTSPPRTRICLFGEIKSVERSRFIFSPHEVPWESRLARYPLWFGRTLSTPRPQAGVSTSRVSCRKRFARRCHSRLPRLVGSELGTSPSDT